MKKIKILAGYLLLNDKVEDENSGVIEVEDKLADEMIAKGQAEEVQEEDRKDEEILDNVGQENQDETKDTKTSEDDKPKELDNVGQDDNNENNETGNNEGEVDNENDTTEIEFDAVAAKNLNVENLVKLASNFGIQENETFDADGKRLTKAQIIAKIEEKIAEDKKDEEAEAEMSDKSLLLPLGEELDLGDGADGVVE